MSAMRDALSRIAAGQSLSEADAAAVMGTILVLIAIQLAVRAVS